MKNLKTVLLLAIIFSVISLIEISSISSRLLIRQVIYLLIAVGIFILSKQIPLKVWRTVAPAIYLFSIFLLIIVLIMPGGGSKRWLHLGIINPQPSELAKLATILVIPMLYERFGRTIDILKAGVLAAIPALLVLLEPDLTTSLTFFVIFISISFVLSSHTVLLLYLTFLPLGVIFSFSKVGFLIFMSLVVILTIFLRLNMSTRFIFIFSLIVVGLFSPILINKALKPYQRARIVAFLNPERYRTGPGWQLLQAKIALGSGGITGKGYKKGTQKGLSFLPEAHTDFIFSAIGEEFGLLATSTIIFGFLFFLFRLYDLTELTTIRYSKGVISGIIAYFLYHIVVNIATNLGLFPVTGLPLPFMSFGGSHLIIEFLLLGILYSIVRRESESRLIQF